MRKIWIGVLILIIAALAVSLIVTQTKKEPEEIKIGAIFALTGDAAMYGESAKNGLELAIEELNKKLLDKKITVVYEDNQGDPSKAVSSFQKLADVDKVKYIIGPLGTPEVLAVAPIAEKKKIIILTPTSSGPQLTQAGDYIFRNCMSDLIEGSALAEFVFKELKARTAGILYINNDYGIGLRDAFKKRFDVLGGEILAEESFRRGDTDFRTQLLKIKFKNPHVLLLIGYAEMGQILKQARELGIKIQVVSTSNFEMPEILEIAGNAAENIYYTYQGFDIESEEEVVKKFANSYRAKYNKEPDIFAALTYDAMKILAKAIERGGTDVENVKKELYGIKNFIGVTGKTSFDKNGDVIKPIGIKKVENGKFIWVNKKFEFNFQGR